jgi:stearoyl-CoA desaturase (delta-9 desaturase)
MSTAIDQLTSDDGKMVNRKFVVAYQRRHVLLFNALPLLGTIVAIVLACFFPIGWLEISLFLGAFFLTFCVGGTVGLHRYFAHGSFETSRAMRIILAVLGEMSAQGPIVSWVVTHRRHHEYSDKPGDPHSPHLHGGTFWQRIRGFWFAHFQWMVAHDMPNPVHYAPDLLRDRAMMKVNGWYNRLVVVGILIPGLIGALATQSWWGFLMGIMWGGFVRICVMDHGVWSINSFCHVFGFRSYDTREESRNNIVLALPTFGEAWHNNHHAFPTSAPFGLKWWQLDIGYIVICVLEKLGLVWNVKRPKPKDVEPNANA